MTTTRLFDQDLAQALRAASETDGPPRAGFTQVSDQHVDYLPNNAEAWQLIVQETATGSLWAIPWIDTAPDPRHTRGPKVRALRVYAEAECDYRPLRKPDPVAYR